MPRARKAAAPRRPSLPAISRGNVPIDKSGPPPAPTGPRPEPTPEEQEKLLARGTLMAVLYAETGSYAKVADLFGVAQATVRWWCHEHRRRSKAQLETIAKQLRGDIAQLAVDRVQEGLLEGETEFAALLGAKLLHGLGELKTHSAVKNDAPIGNNTLTLNIVRLDPSKDAPEIAEGAVVGVPYLVAEGEVLPQTSADAE